MVFPPTRPMSLITLTNLAHLTHEDLMVGPSCLKRTETYSNPILIPLFVLLDFHPIEYEGHSLLFKTFYNSISRLKYDSK